MNSTWGTDQIRSYNDYDTDLDNRIFAPAIQKRLEWPVKKTPQPVKKKVESFIPSEIPEFDTKHIFILLIIILVICVLTYNSMRRTEEAVKLLFTIISKK